MTFPVPEPQETPDEICIFALLALLCKVWNRNCLACPGMGWTVLVPSTTKGRHARVHDRIRAAECGSSAS